MSATIWEGRGQLAGWKVAMMGGRPVARFNGRLVGNADQPPTVRAQIKAAGAPAPPRGQQPLPLAAPRREKKAAPCRCPPAERTTAPKKKKAADCGPTPQLLPRASRKAKLFVWFAPARKPNAKRGGGLRYVGGWPDDNASAAMAAAKAKSLPAGLLYICDEALTVLKTATKAGE